MKVGSLVECVRFDWPIWAGFYHPVLPKRDKVYTIRGIIDLEGEIGVYLEEITSRHGDYGCEQAFNISRFRELLPPISINIEELITQEI